MSRDRDVVSSSENVDREHRKTKKDLFARKPSMWYASVQALKRHRHKVDRSSPIRRRSAHKSRQPRIY